MPRHVAHAPPPASSPFSLRAGSESLHWEPFSFSGSTSLWIPLPRLPWPPRNPQISCSTECQLRATTASYLPSWQETYLVRLSTNVSSSSALSFTAKRCWASLSVVGYRRCVLRAAYVILASDFSRNKEFRPIMYFLGYSRDSYYSRCSGCSPDRALHFCFPHVCNDDQFQRNQRAKGEQRVERL